MDKNPISCVVCAWRETCKKRFLKNEDISFQCPEFTRDITIKDGVTPDVESKDSDDRR